MTSSEATAERPKLTAKPAYVLTLLAAVSFLNYYDRNVINILLQPIKTGLHLTDSEAGLLVGPAFAIVYCFMGVPIARFADRGYRVAVLSAALSFWSIMTALCGAATGFGTLFLARFGVGIGEAGGLPTTHALVAEHYPLERRGSAMSIIAVVAVIGIMAGTLFGGLLNDRFGWRIAFMLTCLPGLIVAAVIFLTVREPRPALQATTSNKLAFGVALRTLARRRSFVFVCAGMAFAALAEYALLAWTQTYLIRHFNLTPGQLGTRYALFTGIPSLIGMLIGGPIVDWWIKRDARASIWILVFTYVVALPFTLVTLLSDNLNTVFTISACSSLFTAIYVGPNYALIQGLAGPKMRATAASIYMLIVNLIGLGAGPLVAGMLSDRLSKYYGTNGLRYALCSLLITYVVAIVLFLIAARTVRADLAEAAKD